MSDDAQQSLLQAVDRTVSAGEPPLWCADHRSAYVVALARSAATGQRWRSAYDSEHERWFAAPVDLVE
ncbi:hypothetical protein [Phytoactinopolyspora mesophila]|uniref:Uncharacterized protein n=1 Tax=Phytoactinopolyspora mesophila TaxID=2650750 RepID=A0A7K3M5X7_9ACTN|nr:hypothetical protein [Phytoactinopolyspora mesophila]NDL58620.1 hypothetical protein [Phytoactinopolyspora mesophila]